MITYTTDTIKVPQNGRKPPLSQSYGILPSFSLPNTIGFISHEDKIKKEQMEEETFHDFNIKIPNTINTIMQENCCNPSWYRSWQTAHRYKTSIIKSLLWQYSQYQMAQKKEGYSSRTSLLWNYYNNILIKVETLTETFASIRKHNKKKYNKVCKSS